MRERCREREKGRKKKAFKSTESLSLSPRERKEREKKQKREKEVLSFDASSLRSHIATGIATSKRSSDTLSHSLFFFPSALSKQRARAREKHVTPNKKVISDTKE